MDSHSPAGRTDDSPSQSRFSNNPFRSRRRTNTVSSLKPAAEAPLPQQHLQNQQDKQRSAKRHTHHLHGHSIFSRRRLSAWDAASVTSSASSPSADMDLPPENHTKKPSRRSMTLTTSRPFVPSENYPLPTLPPQYQQQPSSSRTPTSYDSPVSPSSYAHLAYESISPPTTASGSHRRVTTSSRPTTTGEGTTSSSRKHSRDSREARAAVAAAANAAAANTSSDAHFLTPISFDDFHDNISLDAERRASNTTSATTTTADENRRMSTATAAFNSTSAGNENMINETTLDSPEPSDAFPTSNPYDNTTSTTTTMMTTTTGPSYASPPLRATGHKATASHSRNNSHGNNGGHSINHHNTRKASVAGNAFSNLRNGRNQHLSGVTGFTRHDNNASSSATPQTTQTYSSHTQSHSNNLANPSSPVSGRFPRQTRAAAGSTVSHRQPRKSLGPGVLTSSPASTYDFVNNEGTTKYPVKRRPSLVGRKSQDTSRVLRGTDHDRSHEGTNGHGDAPDFLVSSPSLSLRAQKTMSMFPVQSPSSHHHNYQHDRHHQQAQSRNPYINSMAENVDPLRSPSTGNQPTDELVRSPGGNGKHTPTAKRMSMVPPHHTGLGARTISPTDVKKLKRMSVVSASSPGEHVGSNHSAAGSGGGKNAPPTPHLDSHPSHLLSHAVPSPILNASPHLTSTSPAADTAGTPEKAITPAPSLPPPMTATHPDMPTLSTPVPVSTSSCRPRSSASMIPRRASATPSRSSSRMTPDANRKSILSGGNFNAGSRYGGSNAAVASGGSAGLGIAYSTPTLRESTNSANGGPGNGNGSNSAGTRSSQYSSSSRLPTPKSRGGPDYPVVATGGGVDGEEVPPVPAIPKVYGSPRISAEQQPSSSNAIGSAFGGADYGTGFGSRKASLPLNMMELSTPPQQHSLLQTPISNSRAPFEDEYSEETPGSVTSDAATAAAAAAGAAASTSASQRTRSFHSVHKASPQSPVPRNKLQPLKLPPLNLAPLSGSIARHIDALKTKGGKKDVGSDQLPMTPPPPIQHSRTPTTPLTASKATFFPTRDIEPEMPRTAHVRRCTSTRFGALLKETGASVNASKNDADECNGHDGDGVSARGSGDAYNDGNGPNDSSVPDVPELPSRISLETTPSSLISGDKGASTPSGLPKGPAVGEITPRSNASTAKLTGPRPLTHHPGSLTKPRTAEGNTSILSNSVGSESVTPKASKHESAPAQQRVGPSVTFSGKPPAIAPAARGSPASKPASLHIRRRSAGGALVHANGGGSGVPVRAPSMGNPPALTATGAGAGAGGPSPDGRNPGPVHQLTHRSSPAGAHLRAGGVGTRSVSTGGKLRPVEHMIDKEDLAAEEEMRRLGHKRRDFEVQARSLDELRKRACPKERVTPAQALRHADLNMFEKGEIIDFKEVYFTGTDKAKKHVGDLHASAANFGYDDDRGDYNIVIGDHLAYRYEVIDVLGKGSFGQVVRCIDHKTGVLVAVKIIRNKKRFHQQALVEVNLLAKLKEWDPHKRHSVVNFTQSFYFRGHLCISTELLGMNLYELIKAHDFKGFSLRIIRRFTKQILSTLVLLHHHRVIHCDLKPENILLAHPLHTEIKTIDFGSSCFENEKVYTYIQSRFYRSPEVILGMSYGMPIDMWSLGCIMAELYTGYPIFPGENEQEQLACIMEIFGPPERHLIEKSSRRKLFFDSNGKPRTTVSSKGRRRRPSSKDLRTALKCDDEAFLDFIARCLRWDPHRRLNPIDALSHEFITGVKATPRARHYSSSNSIRRTVTARPLPEPPNASKATTGTIRSLNNHATISSPSKFSRRPSGVNPNLTPASTAGASSNSSKRLTAAASSSNLISSSLPRVAQRSVSGKPDLSSAAATTSLTS